jgi:DHA1 family bicyclomycin/chloramphenicol resistance-like MFS transporter
MSSLLTRLKNNPSVAMAVMVLVIITGGIETDIFVPSFPELKVYFDTSEAMIQMIIGINFLGLCLSSLVYGPMADAFGRRITLLIGSGIFLLASIGCILSTSIESLLFWRFMQGLGTSAAFVVPGAVIFDIYTKEQAAKILGMYSAIITFAMSLAPIIGYYLNEHLGWQANFIFVGGLSLISFILTVLLVKETLTPEKRNPIHYLSIARNYTKMLTTKTSLWYLIIICCLCSGYIIYISNLSLIFIDHLGVEESYYAYYQGAVLLIFAIVSTFCGRIIQFLGIHKARTVGLLVNIAGGFILLLVALLLTNNPSIITIAMCIYSAGFALCIGIIFSDFMNVFPDIKGLASAMSNFMRLLFMAGMIWLSALIFDGTIIPVAVMIGVFCLITIVSLYFIRNPQIADEKLDL